jgi:hypothetical protein
VVIVDVLVLVGLALVTGVTLWLVRPPKPRMVDGFRVFGEPVPGEKDVLEAIRSLTRRRGEKPPMVTAREIDFDLEWVDSTFVTSPRAPDGLLPDGRHMSGTVVSRRVWPWQAKRYTLRCARLDHRPGKMIGRVWEHAIFAAPLHEWGHHLLPILAGLGENLDDANLALRDTYIDKIIEEVEAIVREKRGG